MKNIFKICVFLVLVSCSGEKDEKFKKYYETGELKLIGNISDDKREGKWLVYTKEGAISQELNYKNDSLYLRKTFIKGNLSVKEELLDSIKHGEVITYYENGNPKTLTNYNKGEAKGLSKTFYQDGKVRSEGIINDNRILDFKQYYPSGILQLETENYDNGETVFYDSSGNKSMIVLFENRQAIDTLKVF